MSTLDDKIEAAAAAFNKDRGDPPPGDPPIEPGKTDPPPAGDPPPGPEPVHSIFSKYVGREFKSEDEVKEWTSSLTSMNTRLEQLSTENNSLKSINEELQLGSDPSKFFLNETEQRRQAALIAHPELNSDALSRAVTTNLAELAPQEILKLHLRLQDGDVIKTEEEATEQLERRYGVSFADGNIPRAIVNQISLDAKMARSSIQQIVNDVKLPAKVDLTAARASRETELNAKRTSLTQKWLPVFEGVGDKIPNIKVSRKFADGSEESLLDLEVDPAYRKEINDSVSEVALALAKTGTEPNEKLITDLLQESLIKFQERYIAKNFASIIRAQATKMETDFANRKANEDHNPRPANMSIRPQPDAKLAASHKATEQAAVDELRGKR